MMDTDNKNVKQATHGKKVGCLWDIVFVSLGLCVVICVWAISQTCGSSSNGQSSDYTRLRQEVISLVEEEAKNEIRIATCEPDKRITKLMEKIDSIGQKFMGQENQTDDTIELSERCLAILAALRERRVYAYMMWAEGQLEKASMGNYEDLEQLSQKDLMALYESLSLVNISIVRENMLNREIMTRLSEIYDCLSKENKPNVRARAIQLQADPLSSQQNIQKRKTLDDF